jgi:hypothetical protein
MKIIGAGFGRTGTLSLKKALETLGLDPCYHMIEVVKNLNHVALWQQAADGDSVEWPQIFARYQACVDWPACTYYRELLAHYPEAKVILSVRDADKWYQSVFDTIYQFSLEMPPKLTRLVLPRLTNMMSMIQKVIWQGTFESRFHDKARAIELFNRHNAEVIATVPTDQLLVFDVREGWGPLCKFLDLPIPDTPFPHENDRKSMQRRIVVGRAFGRLSPWIAIAFSAALIAWLIF